MSVKFIADIGANHNGDMKRMHDLVYTAKDIGCWAVKPQFYDADKLFRGKSPIPKAWEFKYEWFPELRKICTMHTLKLGVSVFHPDHVEMVKPFSDYLKISSFDAMRFDLIDKCLETDLPLHISFGMMKHDDENSFYLRYSEEEFQGRFITYHCVSEYPAKPGHCNLWRFYDDSMAGYSDHSKSPGVIHRAAGLGAEYIEFHLDLDGKGWEEIESNSCWMPHQIAQTIYHVWEGDAAIKKYERPEGYYMQKADPVDGLRPMLKRN